MTHYFSSLPYRQKFLLVLALGVGLFIWLSSVTNFLSDDSVNSFIFFYSFGLPFLFLGFSTIIDLNDNKVFLVWFCFATILLIIAISTRHSDKFIIHRSERFDRTLAFNTMMSDYSTSALKSLFCFLIVYWPLNQLSKTISGNFLVNTFRQKTWTNQDAKRQMTGVDVLFNIILYITIFWSVLF